MYQSDLIFLDMLNIIGLKVRNGDRLILDGLNVTFNHGITGIMGLNGSGKTTLLKAIAGLTRPENGDIWYHGQKIQTNTKWWRSRIGYLAQNPVFYGRMTVQEYLDYMLLLSGISDRLRRKILADQAMELFALQPFSNIPINILSGGVKQRVGLAQAFVHKPSVLLLDEPMNFLDTIERMRIQNMLLTHFKECTILYVGHVINEMDIFCSQILILNKQKCIFHDVPDKLKKTAQGRVKYVTICPKDYERFVSSGVLVLQLSVCGQMLAVKYNDEKSAGSKYPDSDITLQDAYQMLLSDDRVSS